MKKKSQVVAGHEDVRIFDTHVEKIYTSNFDLEVEKSINLHKVSVNNNFISPKVLSYDKQQKTIRFERLNNFIPVKTLYINSLLQNDNSNLSIFFEAGKALASIHSELMLSSRFDWFARKKMNKKSINKFGVNIKTLLDGTPLAFHHCDFGFSNIHFSTDINKIVIIDPSPNLYSSISVNDYGSIYVDIGVFISNLSGRISPKYYIKANWKISKKTKDCFYEGYEHKSEIKLDRNLAEKMGYLLSYSNYARYNAIRREVAMWLQYNSLKNNQVT